eukprot:CAMPEP_0197450298 /NCGR_PEP_ID=MMETSP1175-20131217/24759_1 /TAXON_ID=1003142 /ORGANISM="Triceratium dubium, Strain CCMP147" /LENGTH=233 /DNA_ID=CAMNT_0042982679 /DNA_START=152 /DNA_END=853 /DNA_ORIENTATION=-
MAQTDNDAAIAAALSQQEHERANASLPVLQGRAVGSPFSYPGRRRSSLSGARSATNSSPSPSPLPSPYQPPQSSSQFQSPPSLPYAQRHPHMCEVACVVGNGICVEMMVDSGAQTSVMSSSLARELGLEGQIDRREMGVASGVGKARIVGRIRNVVCALAMVEFNMDFVVLDVPDKLMLLGLDQLRRFKCIIDLEREVLVFGGQGGVDVPMLPPNEQHIDWQNALGGQACTIM